MSIPYYNRWGPFWDYIASMEDQGFRQHPFFGNVNTSTQNNDQNEGGNNSDTESDLERHPGNEHGEGSHPPPPPGSFPPGGFGLGNAPPPPPGPAGVPPPPPPPGASPEGPGAHRSGHRHGHGHHGHRRGGGGMWGRGGPFAGHGGRGRCGGAGGRWGGRRGPWGAGNPFDLGSLMETFGTQFFGSEGNRGFTGGVENVRDEAAAGQSEDFVPPVDVFDTEGQYVVHVSLPGAKKEDVAVNWNSEKSELSITGVVHRPGDEDFIKTLALDERKVGAFARQVRLGSRANPASVNEDAITAKLMDGILRITVPKEDKDFVEVRKVDVQ